MGKVFRLTFAVLLGALGIVLTKLPTPDPARRPGIAPPRVLYSVHSQHFLIWSMLTLRRWREGSSSHFLSTVCTVQYICLSLLNPHSRESFFGGKKIRPISAYCNLFENLILVRNYKSVNLKLLRNF